MITIDVPTGMIAGAEAQWSATWRDLAGPYTVTWIWGDGATPETVAEPANTNSHTFTATMRNDTTEIATYAGYCVVTDADGNPEAQGFSYSVQPNNNPVIESAIYQEATSTLYVEVSSPFDDETLTISIELPDSMQADATSKAATQTGPLSANFQISATNPATGGTGNIIVTVTDSQGRTDQATVSAVVFGNYVPQHTL